MTNQQKTDATRKTLASSMRLFVLLRETLALQGVDKTNPLFDAVSLHANLCGMLIPEKLRMTQAELVALVAQLRGAGADLASPPPPPPADEGSGAIRRRLRALTGRLPAGMQALTPDFKLP